MRITCWVEGSRFITKLRSTETVCKNRKSVMPPVMFSRIALWSLLALFSPCGANLAAEYNHFAALDELEDYKLYWSVDRADKSISFAVEVLTTGWVGFGISSGNGKMKGSDLVIGWVKDCKGYLTVSRSS